MRAMSDARERDGAAGERETDTVGRTASWQQAHAELLRLAKARAGLDFDEGERLLEALRARAARLWQLCRVHRAVVWLRAAADARQAACR